MRSLSSSSGCSADIQQILLVSDAPLEHLALKADAMLAARAPTRSKATVSAATTTSAVTLGSLAAHVATQSEAVQKISTQERNRSRPRFRTPSPPNSDRDFRDKRFPSSRTLEAANTSPINTYGERSRTLSLEGEPAQRFQWIFLVADVPQPIIGADFLVHYGLTVGSSSVVFSRIMGYSSPLIEPIAKRETSGKAKRETSGKAKRMTSGKAKRMTSRKAKRETSGKAKRETSGKAKRETSGKPKRETSGKAKRETSGKAKRETSGKAKRETSGKAKRETSGKAKRETSGKAKRETSGKAKRETSGKAKRETSGKAK
ncbi:germ cell nuclear acidic protein-like [Penaeus vannamei]|uniref:germ cell nuclear acidic protein-like n=1 Tax=Penaeus vannamei TaxID=6689 RepID=UPI00387F639E